MRTRCECGSRAETDCDECERPYCRECASTERVKGLGLWTLCEHCRHEQELAALTRRSSLPRLTSPELLWDLMFEQEIEMINRQTAAIRTIREELIAELAAIEPPQEIA